MHISDEHLDEVRTVGFTVMEEFVEPDLLAAAQENLWDIYPRPEDYFRDPETHRRLVRGQFSGLRHYPFPGAALNQLVVHPDLVNAASRYCGATDLDIYKVELWGKYSGAVDYDQAHHRDYAGHTLTVTKDADDFRMMTTFILLSDVTLETGPTKVVPLEHTGHLPRHLGEIEPERDEQGPFGRDAFSDVEVSITAKAGSIFIYHPDVVHRGSALLGHETSRFALLVDFSPIRKRWTGKQSWPTHATSPLWKEPFVAMTPYERTLFGFPGVDDDFWDAQTIRDTGNRYTGMDMNPYIDAQRSKN
jgi:ectoine hydroxylase-related dioxygenase (phytanoyl-CoA dioxygenase family)